MGTAKSASLRVNTLNTQGYGGANDWQIVSTFQCNKAGLIEYYAQREMLKYRTYRVYIKDGQKIYCQELFECEVDIGHNAVIKAIQYVEKNH